jgi:hypothetical protein
VNLISKKQYGFKWFAPLFGVMLAAASVTVTGCSSVEEDLCAATCDCEGCSDSAYDNCVDDAEDRGRVADNEGCGTYYYDWLDCLDSEFACRNAEAEFDGCGPELERLSKCCGASCFFNF